MTRHATLILVSFGILCRCAVGSAEDTTNLPNIVILLADDLGWRDVSFHDGEIATPNIDRIANEGSDLTRFYACPVCSPTRAGLMTGRYPIRYGLSRTVVTPWRDFGLSTDEVTLPEVLAKAGYQHRGAFGKWHLGHRRLKWHPLRRGFTRFHGHYNGMLDYFTHIREGQRDWHIDLEPSDEEGYTTDLIGAAAARFVREHANDNMPFFCYVPFNAPHTPLQAKSEDLENFKQLGAKHGAQRQQLAAMIGSLDDAVGSVLDAIEETGIRDNTLVLFFSDNGGTNIGDNSPYRAGKGTVFEGGTRVAAAIRWPRMLKPRSKVDEPIMYLDILPTLMRIVGSPEHGGKPLDGLDVWDVICGRKSSSNREMFASIGAENTAVWSPPWKLVSENRRKTGPAVYLFDFGKDPYEMQDVSAEHPEVVARLLERSNWYRALEPEDHIEAWEVNRKGFRPPPNWNITQWSEERSQ